MTDFGQFQEPFAEVPLEPIVWHFSHPDRAESNTEENAEVWWVDDDPEEGR